LHEKEVAMSKKLSYVTCRLDPDTRIHVQALADQLGVTVSTMTRSLLERESCSHGVCRDTKAGRLIDASERFAEKARCAAVDGVIDAVERAELTAIIADEMSELWRGDAA